jgi:hypothetical protein
MRTTRAVRAPERAARDGIAGADFTAHVEFGNGFRAGDR